MTSSLIQSQTKPLLVRPSMSHFLPDRIRDPRTTTLKDHYRGFPPPLRCSLLLEGIFLFRFREHIVRKPRSGLVSLVSVTTRGLTYGPCPDRGVCPRLSFLFYWRRVLYLVDRASGTAPLSVWNLPYEGHRTPSVPTRTSSGHPTRDFYSFPVYPEVRLGSGRVPFGLGTGRQGPRTHRVGPLRIPTLGLGNGTRDIREDGRT